MDVRHLAYVFVISLVTSLVACGNPSERAHEQHATFKAKPAEPKAPQANEPPLEVKAPVDSSTTIVAKKQPEAQDPSPLVTKGELQTDLPEYTVPDRVRERIGKVQPELLPAKSSAFQILSQHLTIDVKKQQVTFNGVLRLTGKQDEPFELSCHINTADVPWICTDMTPTNETVAKQKRFQATFKCLDAYRCEQLGVKLWVVVDGKLQAPQLFQAEGFLISRATSGDVEETEDAADTPPQEPMPPTPKPPPKFQDRLKQEPGGKAEKAPLPTQPVPPEAVLPKPALPAITEKELDDLLNDPEAAIEISVPITMPNPSVGKFSLPGVEKLPTAIHAHVRIQAVGWHNRGILKKAAEFPATGPGFLSRDHGRKDFATDMTLDLIEQSLAQMNKKYPDRPPVVIGQVANATGGEIKNLRGVPHRSHQTGLDADIGLPSFKPQTGFRSACGDSGCHSGSKIEDSFDHERFWMFIKQITCAEGKPVIAMFLDREIKKSMCRYVRERTHEDIHNPKACAFRALQALHHEDGHDNHVHIRFACPEHEACQNSDVSLANATGC